MAKKQPAPPPVPATRRIRVELAALPALEFEASSNEEAWAKYKEALGIIDSDHEPRFSDGVK